MLLIQLIKMKHILILLLSLLCAKTSAQVGIMTESPKADLDINGDFDIRGKLILRNGTLLMPGKKDQVLVSQGATLPPTWKTLRVPEYEPNKFYLIFNDSFKDSNGVSFLANETSTLPSPNTIQNDLAKGTTLTTLKTKGFKEITGLNQLFSVNSTESKVYIQFETVVQVQGGDAGNIKYACGIFVNDKLESVRVNMLQNATSTGSFLTHTQIGSISGLLPSNNHKIQVACARYNTSTSSTQRLFTIGTWAQNNLNSFITQSSLKVDVYEIPQNFKSIFD